MCFWEIDDQIIKTKAGEYSFKPMVLYHGRKCLDNEVASENLRLLSVSLEENAIRFGLINGTLLGVIRNNDFIPYDEDIDLFVFDNQRDDLFRLLDSFIDMGFKIARYKGDLLTLVRKNNFVDISFYKKENDFYVSDSIKIPDYFLNELGEVLFKGNSYKIPFNSKLLLRMSYGNDWMIPRIRRHNTLARGGVFFKRWISMRLPARINFYIAKGLLLLRQNLS